MQLVLIFKKIAIHALILSAIPLALVSQTDDKKSLRLHVDYAQFWGDSVHTKLEIYQCIERDGLTRRAVDDYLIADFLLETVVTYADSIIRRGEIHERDTVRSRATIDPGQQFVFAFPLFLKPGEYFVTTTLRDLNSSREATTEIHVNVAGFRDDFLTFSDIELATDIERAKKTADPLVKSRLRIMPNTQRIYGDGMERFSLYAELYNLMSSREDSGTFKVDYIIEDQQGKELHRIPGNERKKLNDKTAIYTSFDISSLKMGNYIIRLEAVDLETNTSATISKPFKVFRRSEALAYHLQQERKVYDELDAEAIEHYFKQIKYIATENEKNVFQELTLDGKRDFLVEFWKRRDPSPGTAANEFKQDYIERLYKSGMLFREGGTEGWRTDRGRILLTYGRPDFIDREPSSGDKNAYEIWHFEQLGGGSGSIFVFVQLKGSPKTQLVHSDYREEVSNPEWRKALYR